MGRPLGNQLHNNSIFLEDVLSAYRRNKLYNMFPRKNHQNKNFYEKKCMDQLDEALEEQNILDS